MKFDNSSRPINKGFAKGTQSCNTLAGFNLRASGERGRISDMFLHRPFLVRRWVTRICTLLLCFAGPGTGAAAPTLPSYYLRTWQTEDGLPENVVTAIVQTRDGYLWVGTYDGLARFDGASFTVFDNNNTPEMSSSRVISLFEDREGNLWIGHETGELTRYRDGHCYTVKFNPAWEDRKISGIGADSAGRIWVLNEEGKLAGVNGEMLAVTNAGVSTRAASLIAGEHGALWVVYGGQVFTLEHGQIVPLGPDSQSLGYVEAICPSRGGGLWMVGDQRLRKWNDGGWVEDLGPTPWGQSPITTLIEMRSGCLAVGTLDRGLYLIFPSGVCCISVAPTACRTIGCAVCTKTTRAPCGRAQAVAASWHCGRAKWRR